LGVVEQGIEVPGVLVGQLVDLARDDREPAPHRLVLDDPRVLRRVGAQGHDLIQAHQVGRSTNGLELPAHLQLFA
jgi:hypothetical protein